MAINVDLVYKTVLLILNQQQRGYITPDEFNKVGNQVQLGIFEKYMSDLNQQLRIPENDSEYANRVKNLEEKLDIFKRIGSATFATPYFNLPTTATTATSTQTFTVPALPNPATNTIYNVTNWSPSQSQNALIKVFKNGVLQTSPAQYSFNTTSNNITFVTAPAINDIIIAELYPSDFYRLGTVIYKNDTLVQMVERNEFYLIQRSPLTAATKVQPIFLYEDEKLQVFPTTITSDINVSYIKKPNQPQWGYSIGSLGQFLYNPSSSTNFELHVSEQVDLITGILLYSGVIIQDPTIIQVASQQIQQEDINEKS
jgi:hypothetical protein